MNIFIKHNENLSGLNVEIKLDPYYLSEEFDFSTFFELIGNSTSSIEYFKLWSIDRSFSEIIIGDLQLDILFSMIME